MIVIRHRGAARTGLLVLLVIVAAIGGAVILQKFVRRPSRPVVVDANYPPATQPATHPAPPAPIAPPIPKATGSYLQVVRAAYPDFPATQPLDFPLDLAQAAHLVVHDPIYLSNPPRADLWITREDAEPTQKVLTDAMDPTQDLQVHVTRERVVFVHWMPSDSGPWVPYLICPDASGGFEAVSGKGRQPLPRKDYRWNHAMSWNDTIIVPCQSGVSILRLKPKVIESYHELAPEGSSGATANLAEPQVLLDLKGVLAWLPWEQGKTGGHGASRFVDDKWIDLGPDQGIPEKVLHLVPLNDGNALVIARGDGAGVNLSLVVLDRIEVDQKKIAELVGALGDPDDDNRKAAYKQLTTYGSGIWPILEKMMDDQEPEAQARLRLLLKEKVEPTLGGMSLIGEKSLQLAARLQDGGTVFYAEQGVEMPRPNPDVDPTIIAPAWISIRPGEPIELLPPALVGDLSPGRSKIYAVGSEWLVTTDVRGPRRFIGNGLVTLLRKTETAYSDFVGEDRRGRWLFRQPVPQPTTQPATAPTTPFDPNATLIIDPTLPDPTPRLPVWVFRNARTVGWTKDNWPVAKDVSAYALHESDWQLLDEKEPVYTKPEEVPREATEHADAGNAGGGEAGNARHGDAETRGRGDQKKDEVDGKAQTRPATNPATQPAFATTQPAIATTQPAIATAQPTTDATTQSIVDQEPRPILIDRDGTRYYDGLTMLRIVDPKGNERIWSLPPIAVGEGPATLIHPREGHFFLFNQRGRVLRLRATPDELEPFRIDATFTKHIPTVEHPTRIWLDPADRIIMAWGSQLAIMFPRGYIPPAIAEKMVGQIDVDDQ
jgi:hypothetical protein